MASEIDLPNAHQLSAFEPAQLFEAAYAVDSAGPVAAAVDPTISFRRSGTMSYLLHPGNRQRSIESVGDMPHQQWQENGGEDFWRSMLYFNEIVSHVELPPNPLVVPGENWTFAGPNGISWEVTSAIIAGGEMHGSGATTSTADIRMTNSNTFIFGRNDEPQRHHIFYGFPCPTHPDSFKPTVTRAKATGAIRCIRESNNQTLYAVRLPFDKWGTRQFQIIPIEKMLGEMYPNQLPGENIRVEYSYQSSGSSASRDESKWCIVGATTALAVLPLVRR